MSILKSTNSGRRNILLTVEYLLQNGWYFINTNGVNVAWRSALAPIRIYKDENHSLIIFNNFNKSVGNSEDNPRIMYYDIDEDIRFRFDFVVKTISDLDDLEEYWKDRCIDEELALKKLALNERAKSAVEGYLKAKKVMDNIENQLTNTINNEIIKSMGIPKYRLDNCNTIWVD